MSRSSTEIRLLLVAIQVAGILAVVRFFELENQTVFLLLVVAGAGFLVHDRLPPAYQLPFFALLSVGSVIGVLGLPLGLVVLGLGYLLIGICHLPTSIPVRFGLLIVTGTVCFILRSQLPLPADLALLWPVLASMFMFRLALYAYSLKHNEAPTSLTWSTAYFFMLPNVCYPLFPVVDYKTFVRTRYDADRFHIYEQGVRYLLRGVSHLLVYRLVYYDLAIGELFVNDLGQVVRQVVATFFLYVKVSGQFHLIVGLLGLYGFRLPETNHLYFLASSITDYWRRANIYWKDFMMKLVYYPSFFQLRRYGKTVGVLAGTVIVFVLTWLLHAYQFYWIQGQRLIAKRDIAFWGAFGILALVATWREIRPGQRPQSKTATRWTLRRGLATVATFLTIAVLWSLWSTNSFANWLFMLSQARYSTPLQWAVLGGLLVMGVLLTGFGWGAPTLQAPPREPGPVRPATLRALARVSGMGAAILIALPSVQRTYPDVLASASRHLRGEGTAPMDATNDFVGYYEALARSSSRIAKPWKQETPFGNMTDRTTNARSRKDFLLSELTPGTAITFLGAPFHTNRWGLRDQEYSLPKAPGTYRISVFGASLVMGWGVADGEPFEAQLEEILDATARAQGGRVEVLNFGIASTSVPQQVARAEMVGAQFDSDLLIFTVFPYDLWFTARNLAVAKRLGYPIPDSGLARIVRESGAELRGTDAGMAALRPFEEALDRETFRWAREVASRTGSQVAVLALREPGRHEPGNLATTRRAARSAGMTWLDCTGVWDGQDEQALRLSELDSHPTARGHRLIAECLKSRLLEAARALDLPSFLSPPPA